MPRILWGSLDFTRERIYVFTLFDSIYAFLTFWTVGQFASYSSMAWIGLGGYVGAFICHTAAMRWVIAIDMAVPEERAEKNIDRTIFMRLLFCNFIIFLAFIYSIGKSQLIAQENYQVVHPWQQIVGLLIFIMAYIVSFFFTFIKPDIDDMSPPHTEKRRADVPSGAGNAATANNTVPKTVESRNHVPTETYKPVGQSVNNPANKSIIKTIEQPTQFGDNDWNVFVDLIVDRKIRSTTLAILRHTPDWVNVKPPDDLYNKKGSAFFQQSVIRSLGDARDPVAVPFLIELLGKNYDLSHGVEAFHRPRWPNIGVDVASALARIGKPAAEPLRQALESPNRLTRLYAVCGIALLRDFTLHPALVEALGKEKDAVVQTYLKRTLANLERKEFISPNCHDLTVIIESTSSKVQTGEPVKFYWKIRNDGSYPLMINMGSAKEIKQMFMVKALQDQTSIFLSPYDSDSTPGPEDLITLTKGEFRRVGPFDLREFFDLKKPGPYEIQGTYRNHFPGIEYGIYAVEGRLVSEPVVIEVTPLL